MKKTALRTPAAPSAHRWNAGLRLSLGALACWLACFPNAARGQQQQQNPEVRLTKEKPGELAIDTRKGNLLLRVPQKGKTFGTMQNAVDWAVETLNGVRVYDKDKRLSGVRGHVVQYGNVYRPDDKSKTLFEIGDPIAWMLGGEEGFLTVGEKRSCVVDEICGHPDAKPQALRGQERRSPGVPILLASHASDSETICDSHAPARFCGKFSSSVTDFIFYHYRGAKTKQDAGGFVVVGESCFLFWCWDDRDYRNSLTLSVEYFYSDYARHVPVAWFGASPSCVNCSSVSDGYWSLFVGANPSNYPCPTLDCEIDGVCGIHSDRGVGSVNGVGGFSGDGGHDNRICRQGR